MTIGIIGRIEGMKYLIVSLLVFASVFIGAWLYEIILAIREVSERV